MSRTAPRPGLGVRRRAGRDRDRTPHAAPGRRCRAGVLDAGRRRRRRPPRRAPRRGRAQAGLRARRRRVPARRDRQRAHAAPQGAARRRDAVAAGVVDAGDGDDPQPRDDDDRGAARPERRSGQHGLRPRRARGARPRPALRHPDRHGDPAAQPARLPHRARCSARSTCTASSAAAPPTAGSRPRSSRSPGTRPTSSRCGPPSRWSTRFDPHLMFVNLGDIDRFGHADFTGQSVRLQRRLALADTDRLVGDFVALLKRSGRWQHSMVLVLADHSMDWSRPDRVISLQGVMDDDPFLSGKVVIAGNGGADLLYWTGARTDRDRAIARMRALAARRARRPGRARAHPPVAAARPRGRRRARLLPGRLALQRPRRRSSTTRSRATTGTPPPGRSRSSSAAATPAWPAGRRRRRTPRRSTSRPPWRRSSASVAVRAVAGTVAPASSADPALRHA